MKNLTNLTEMEKLITKDALKKYDAASKVIFDDLEIEGFEIKQVEDFFKQRLQLLFESNELHGEVVSSGNVFQLQAEAKNLIKDVNSKRNSLREVLETLQVDFEPLVIHTSVKNKQLIQVVKIEIDYSGIFYIAYGTEVSNLKFQDVDDCVDWLIENRYDGIIEVIDSK